MILETVNRFGFQLKKNADLKEIHGDAYLLEHKKSGAELFYIKSEDKNKVFSIAFKTPPTDDTGVAHILEHSVLCGSKKYQAKDPFNELAKGSLNTFLNAMTYADKTVYPIASCNEDDFHNLMDVYLDAVFHPNIYEKKEIFMQEGWRYVHDAKTNQLDLTGVVYNEMKGVFSDPESTLSSVIARSLFGETTYGFESGGDPKAIPSLSYEDFLNFHRSNYHPSNSYIYLYGDMDLERCLANLNEYLNDYERKTTLPIIAETKFIGTKEPIRETFPVASGKEQGGAGYFAYTVKVGKCTDAKRILAMQILSNVLFESNSSSFKRQIQETGICEEIEGWFDSSTYEMAFSIIGKNVEEVNSKCFVELIEATLKKAIQDGLDQKLLDSTIRLYEFHLRENEFSSMPKGLAYGLRSLKTLLHGEEPFVSLGQLEVLDSIKNDTSYWHILLSELIETSEKTFIIFMPEEGKGSREDTALQEALSAQAGVLTELEKEALATDAQTLYEFQTQEDTPEIMAQIPLLALEQISKEPEEIIYHTKTLDKVPLIQVPLPSNGILYGKLQFSTEHLPEALLPYIGLLARILGKLDTETYSYEELPIEILNRFGGISFKHQVHSISNETCRSFFTVNFKVLKDDLQTAIALLEEILFHTKFDEIQHLLTILKMEMLDGESQMTNHSHLEAVQYSTSGISHGAHMAQQTDGIKFYHFLRQTLFDFAIESKQGEVIEKIKEATSFLFQYENLEIAIGGENEDCLIFEESILPLVHLLPKSESNSLKNQSFTATPSQTAFETTGTVQYNVLSFDFAKLGVPYHGSMEVLRTIVNLEFLWNSVRVRGGAYGCGAQFLKSGIGYFYSYRDPNLEKTYQVYQELYQELSRFKPGQQEMQKFILGTINHLDQPKTNREIFQTAIQHVYRNIDHKWMCKQRQEVLNTSMDDILQYIDLLKKISETNNICTIGNTEKIKEQSQLFSTIELLLP